MSKEVKRLFNHFRPEHYGLTIDIEKFEFQGEVVIIGRKTGPPSKRITLHQKELTIQSAEVIKLDKKNGAETIDTQRINPHAGYDEVRLHFGQTIYPGKYQIKIAFSGKITPQMQGLYPCFFEHDGQQKHLLATQFESHHAREVFPCIDEPEAKATFELKIACQKVKTVLSNTPIKAQKTINQKLITEFERTPKMSTYLLAFVIGQLDFKEATTKNGVTLRAYATPDNVQFTNFALDTAVRCLEFYNKYFDIDYPLAKCDLVALPDFASGAMENWGLITYREQAVLVDPNNTGLSNKQWVAMVVAHELAHQWFGNLVTMRWWTDLWLNEGFASWIEYLAIDYLYPDWDMWTQFIASEQQSALKLDALQHTHPVEVPIKHPDEIKSIFDAISYNKGASIINMLHDYLGPKQFKQGLRHYLKKYSHSNTDTKDLWAALEEASQKPVIDFMQAWTSQPGFPAISLNKKQISQQRFLINPTANLEDQSTWPVPLLDNQGCLPDLLKTPQKNINLTNVENLKINSNQAGFYRTIYSKNQLEDLAESLRKDNFSPLDRLGILSDVFETAKAGKLDTVDSFKILKNYKNENNNAVWDVIAGNISSVRQVMDSQELRDLMKPYVIQLTNKQLKRLGWEVNATDSHFDKLLRPTILGLSASSDHFKTTEIATSKFKKSKKIEDIHPDVRDVVYATSARIINDQITFDKLVDLYQSTSLSEARFSLAVGITQFRDPAIIQQALNLIISDLVRPQDVAYWVAYSLKNRFARHATWQWIRDNWSWLEQTIGGDLSFYRFPIYAASVNSSNRFLNQYKNFFEPKRTPALDRSINQGIEILQWHIAWRKRDLKNLLQFFEQA